MRLGGRWLKHNRRSSMVVGGMQTGRRAYAHSRRLLSLPANNKGSTSTPTASAAVQAAAMPAAGPPHLWAAPLSAVAIVHRQKIPGGLIAV